MNPAGPHTHLEPQIGVVAQVAHHRQQVLALDLKGQLVVPDDHFGDGRTEVAAELLGEVSTAWSYQPP